MARAKSSIMDARIKKLCMRFALAVLDHMTSIEDAEALAKEFEDVIEGFTGEYQAKPVDIELDLERQFNEKRLEADDLLDEWLLAAPQHRHIVLTAQNIQLVTNEGPITFRGVKPQDSRAQAAMALQIRKNDANG